MECKQTLTLNNGSVGGYGTNDTKEPTIKEESGEYYFSSEDDDFYDGEDREINLHEGITDSSGTVTFISKAFAKKMVPQEVFFGVLEHCSTEIKEAIKEDPVTLYKQMIAWTIRCGLTGALWVGGYTGGAYLEGVAPPNASQSIAGWTSAGGVQGLGELICVIFIGKYLSDSQQIFKTDHHNPWPVEGIIVGMSCVLSGVLWQPAVNGGCSTDDLSQVFPVECMAKVGLSTGASFFATLQLVRALTTLIRPTYFRATSIKVVASDLLYTLFASLADMAFVLTATQSIFNYPGYSNNSQYEMGPTVVQMGYGAVTAMLGGFVGLVSIGGVNAAVRFYENYGEVPQALKEYWDELSFNSQCNLF